MAARSAAGPLAVEIPRRSGQGIRKMKCLESDDDM